MNRKHPKWLLAITLPFIFVACSKDDPESPPSANQHKVTVENILPSKPLVESGTFEYSAASPLIMPGSSVSIHFSASFGQAVSFAAMYGFSNDLFFAPKNPGITVYDDQKKPIEGDVSDQVMLWDNGTRINEQPGPALEHPGVAQSSPIKMINGNDDAGNSYLPASKLVKATLKYDGDSYFTLTLENTSGGTDNETPLSPGVWAVSYIAGGELLAPNPLFTDGQPTANGLTALAETGDNTQIYKYVQDNTGAFTPFSPVLVVVYKGSDNPLFKVGENDPGNGLKDLAQKGDATKLAAHLKEMTGVSHVYVLPAENTTVLLPATDKAAGSKVTETLAVGAEEHIAIATMYGFSNDWFFATSGAGIDPSQPGDYSDAIHLYDDGTATDQYPGAGSAQFNLGGNTTEKQNVIQEVPNPNMFNTLPAVKEMIKVTIE